jgi:sugar lactone lactonase YvrE
VEKLSLSNGLGWSPDNKTMYLIDTLENHILQFDFNLEDGSISNKKPIITIPDNDGSPDGMCVDEEGMVWIALYGGKKVVRYNPKTADRLAEVDVPAQNITCCVFGGPDLGTMYITTASEGVDEAGLRQFPQTGSVFSVQLPVKGLPVNRFRY